MQGSKELPCALLLIAFSHSLFSPLRLLPRSSPLPGSDGSAISRARSPFMVPAMRAGRRPKRIFRSPPAGGSPPTRNRAPSLAIDMAGDTQLGITDLRNGVMQIGLTQGRLGLNLRRLGGDETAEVDIPQGGVRLLQPGIYDIDSGTADRPARITVFEGSARFVSGGADMTIKAGDAVVLNGTDVATAKAERAVADDFVKWCRSRDYQEHKLAAPYYVSPAMTGFQELDAYGGWATVPQYGAIWYPNSVPGDWAPYRDGQWVWVESRALGMD